ncbi:MAG: IPT/TIG domain-containing protein [Candidatus Delongbacteria bacterium]|nr:IPT/TIG domain-containing protein [Candidatus Delongbacteria bacterium]
MKRSLILSLAILSGLISYCSKTETDSLYQDNKQYNADPVVSSVEPADSALAGVVTITLSGQNFSTDKDLNAVFFGKTKCTILSASANQLIIQSPTVTGTLDLKATVLGALNFSNPISYKLLVTVQKIGLFLSQSEFYSIACDKDENLYIVNAYTKNIQKVTPDGQTIDLANNGLGSTTCMLVGPNDSLYITRGTKLVYRIPLTGAKEAKWITAPITVNAFDFGEQQQIYIGGKADAIHIVDRAGKATAAADYPNVIVSNIRVLNGYVYVAGQDQTSKLRYIWRNRIESPTQLAAREVFMEWAAIQPDANYYITSMTGDLEGNIYLGSNDPKAAYVVHSDKTFEQFYTGMMEPTIYDMAWGNNEFMYVCKRGTDATQNAIQKVNMMKKGAPYYGRN